MTRLRTLGGSREAPMPKYHYAAAVLLAATVSCANSGATNEEPLTPASNARSTDEDVGGAEEDLGDAQECRSNEDCGEGFVCGFDRGRSQIMKYCM